MKPRLYIRGWFVIDPNRLWRDPDGRLTFRTRDDLLKQLAYENMTAHVLPVPGGCRILRETGPTLEVVTITNQNRRRYEEYVTERHGVSFEA